MSLRVFESVLESAKIIVNRLRVSVLIFRVVLVLARSLREELKSSSSGASLDSNGWINLRRLSCRHPCRESRERRGEDQRIIALRRSEA